MHALCILLFYTCHQAHCSRSGVLLQQAAQPAPDAQHPQEDAALPIYNVVIMTCTVVLARHASMHTMQYPLVCPIIEHEVSGSYS